MALSICLEAFFRLFFLIIKFWWNHLILLFLIILITYILSRTGLLGAGIFATAIDYLGDTSTTVATLFSGGLWGITAGISVQLIIGLAVGLLWVAMLFLAPLFREETESKTGVSLLIKSILAIPFFIIGFICGAIPAIPLVPISLLLSAILFFPSINLIFCLALSIAPWFIPQFCLALNIILKLVS